ncbi:fire blight resistance locus LG12 [Pyrus ussuriensis x Pyrus communis]|uniref:Fire blight resistance locus LG12 n=1 Tax=Pyrus ussuriensis x Pyrus communis TaxID=2448454 RepID=A0A5N5G3U2_9ROSA|nr:fire blight resistance locus LG12 [Pyrus ussuriensis x Pyrus communis]
MPASTSVSFELRDGDDGDAFFSLPLQTWLELHKVVGTSQGGLDHPQEIHGTNGSDKEWRASSHRVSSQAPSGGLDHLKIYGNHLQFWFKGIGEVEKANCFFFFLQSKEKQNKTQRKD